MIKIDCAKIKNTNHVLFFAAGFCARDLAVIPPPFDSDPCSVSFCFGGRSCYLQVVGNRLSTCR